MKFWPKVHSPKEVSVFVSWMNVIRRWLSSSWRVHIFYNAVQNATCQWKSSSLYQEDKVTEKLHKLWAPEIYLECYCAAREAQPIRCGNTKPRAAMVMALWPARMPWSSMYSRNTMNIPKIFQVFMVLLVWQQEPRNRSFPGLSPVDWGGTWIQALSNSLMYCLLFRLFPN